MSSNPAGAKKPAASHFGASLRPLWIPFLQLGQCGIPRTAFRWLIGVALNASCTNLNPEGTRRHIRAALHEGATREEILLVLKMASLMSIQSCGLGGSSLLEEASEASLDAAGVGRAKRLKEAGGTTPAIDKMKAIGQWNEVGVPF